MPDLTTPILILGGGTGGVAAALAIARVGGSCVVVEPTDWIGGQLTAQAVPPDENRWVEGDGPGAGAAGFVGATKSYVEFREHVRRWYRENRPLNDAARANARLNPGGGWVSRLCCEPRVAHAVLQDMLAPHVAAGRVQILLRTEPVAADVDEDRVRAVTVQHLDTGRRTTIAADYFLDATELGDLFPLTGVEYHVGAEDVGAHGELHARTDRADPKDQQAISWCFAIEHRPGENHVIDRPARYEFFRDFAPHMIDHPWPGRLLSWTVAGFDYGKREYTFRPWPDEPRKGETEMWRYRRIVDRSLYRPDAQDQHPDVCLVNWVQMDYFLNAIVDVTPEERRAALADARQQSLSLLYWLQTEAPRFDGSDGVGFPGLRICGDELGTTDGFAKSPYIRESRRLAARTIVHEGHVGAEQRRRDGRAKKDQPGGGGEPFPDSVGIGHYNLDLHPSTAMRNHVYVESAPFRIPLGALIPVRVRNVLAAAKNLGVTHVTNGCYRLHPVEWNTGESAGLLAQHCLTTRLEPQQVHERMEHVREFQRVVTSQGIPIAWPWEKSEGLC
jgi:hypothetical protein